ncbi:MAG: protein kinase [Deltaproteobacteria bacterium]|nr:protein kinase [Deltaproteobacteria bacterium]
MTTEGAAPEQFGSYLMLEQIGDGGMAEIFLAKMQGYSGFEKMVALKRILPRYSQNPAFAKMLIHEAKLAARIQHNNVVQVLDLGEALGRVYIAMEYIRGRDLAAILSNTYRRKEFLPVPLALFVGTEFLTGLDFAHRLIGSDGRPLGLIHRDISPQNILISFEGEVKVTDFGIARVIELGDSEALPGNLHGKFGYMSPEQAQGHPLDQRSDVFSSGIVIHETLTGKRLFRGKTPQATVELVLRHKIPLPSSVNPDVPKEIDDIVMRSLAREVNERYQTVGALLGDLGRAADRMASRAQRRDLAVYMRRQFGAKVQKKRPSISPYSPSPGARVPLGELFVRKGVITYEDLEIGLAEQRARGGRIGEVLVEAGNVTEEQLTDALAEQSGIKALSAGQLMLQKPEPTILSRFPRRVAEQVSALAISVDTENKALLAVSDPYDNRSLLEAKVVLGVEEADIRLITRTALRDAILAWYPKVTEPPPKPAPEPEPAAPAGPTLVLFADGNVAEIEPLAARIRAEDCEVVIAKDGKKAREICRTSIPSIALLDAALPGIDGFNILLELRGKNPDAAIFITSGRKDEFREAKALELGADDFLVKPFSLEVVASKIRREIQKRANTRRRAPVAAPASFRGVSGSLGDMTLVDIVQSLEVGRKTAHVVLQYEDERGGELRVDDGEVRGCISGELSGEDAFYRLAPSADGIFRIEYRASEIPTNIHSVNTALVLEALRREDSPALDGRSEVSQLEQMFPDGPKARPETPRLTPVRPPEPSRTESTWTSGTSGSPLSPSPVSPSPVSPPPGQGPFALPVGPPPAAWSGPPQTGAWPQPGSSPQTPPPGTGQWQVPSSFGPQASPPSSAWRAPTNVPPPHSATGTWRVPTNLPAPAPHTATGAWNLPPKPQAPPQTATGTWNLPPLEQPPAAPWPVQPPPVNAWPQVPAPNQPPDPRAGTGTYPRVDAPPPWSPQDPRTATGTWMTRPRSATPIQTPARPVLGETNAPAGRAPPNPSTSNPASLPRSGSGVAPAQLPPAPAPRTASGARPPPLPKPRGQSGVQSPETIETPAQGPRLLLDPLTGELVVPPELRDDLRGPKRK